MPLCEGPSDFASSVAKGGDDHATGQMELAEQLPLLGVWFRVVFPRRALRRFVSPRGGINAHTFQLRFQYATPATVDALQ